MGRELAQSNLALVVPTALPAALAVREANPRMPMVIGTCPGLVANGFAKSMERPGGIYTGVDELPPCITARRLQLLKRPRRESRASPCCRPRPAPSRMESSWQTRSARRRICASR
jgi:hypothetical protein